MTLSGLFNFSGLFSPLLQWLETLKFLPALNFEPVGQMLGVYLMCWAGRTIMKDLFKLKHSRHTMLYWFQVCQIM